MARARGRVARRGSLHADLLPSLLRRRGFRFVGPTTAYALMQAVGIVNDHLERCADRDEVEVERSRAVKALA